MKRGKKLYLTLASVAAVILLTVAVYSSVTPDKNASILKKHQFIGHAFGEIDGHTYTNSLEAFKTNYDKGRRVFEVDFSVTADGFVVCFHDGKEAMYGLKKYIWNTPRLEFKKSKILGRYTPMDIFDLVRIMRDYKDIYIVTDVKGPPNLIAYAHTMLLMEARKIDNELANRIIPQVYDENTYYETMKVYPFPEIIYTLYRTNSSDARVVDFLKRNPNITALTVSTKRFNPGLAQAAAELGRAVYVHTINDRGTMDNYREKGAFGFYTDSYFDKTARVKAGA